MVKRAKQEHVEQRYRDCFPVQLCFLYHFNKIKELTVSDNFLIARKGQRQKKMADL